METSDHQSQSQRTEPMKSGVGDEVLNLLKSDLAKFLTQVPLLIEELAGIKTRLDRIEGTLRDIAIGLGVVPK
jgi:hypothetical protein